MFKRQVIFLSLVLSMVLTLSLGIEVTFAADSVTPQISTKTTLTRADLDFGEKQLKRLVADRPQMKSSVSPQDSIWIAATRGFAGEACGRRISWNPDAINDKPYSYVADHEWPSPPSYKGNIRMRYKDEKGVPYPSEALWSALFYEFYNIGNAEAFEKLYKRACKGEFTRKQWLTETTKLEYRALKKMENFYKQTWLPHVTSKHLPSDPEVWRYQNTSSYESWIAGYTDPNGYPNNYWGDYYDKSITPYLNEIKPHRKRKK